MDFALDYPRRTAGRYTAGGGGTPSPEPTPPIIEHPSHKPSPATPEQPAPPVYDPERGVVPPVQLPGNSERPNQEQAREFGAGFSTVAYLCAIGFTACATLALVNGGIPAPVLVAAGVW